MSDVIEVIDREPEVIEVIDPPSPRLWVGEDRGPKGDPGAVPPSLLAERPAASSVPAGTLHYATDSDTPIAISTGSAWVTPPAVSPYVTHVTDETNNLTTTIEALNTYYRIGSLETSDVVWPGGLARVTVHDLEETAAGHVLTATDTARLDMSTDSGSSWTAFGRLVAFVKSATNAVWIPERPIAGVADIDAGTTVRFRVAIARIFAGDTPVAVPWNDAPRRLVVEALR